MNENFNYSLEKVSSLRIKLITVFSVLFAVTFAIISLASYMVSKSIITSDIDTQTQEVVNGHAAEIDQWVMRMLSIVSAYSHLIERGIPDDENVTSGLLGNYSRGSFFSDLYYATSSGKFTSGRNWTPPPGYNPCTRPWYTAAVKKSKTAISDLYLDYETNTHAFSISSPVYNRDGSLRGVLSADLLLRTLDDKLKNIRVSGMGNAVLIDSSGTALVHPDKSFIGKSLLDRPELRDVIKIILDKKSGRIEYNTGDEKITVYTPIPSCGWILGIVLTKKDVYSDLNVLALKFSLLFLVSIIIVILTSKYFAGKLTYFMILLERTVETQTSELKDKIAEVEYLSLTDSLTGISNRRKIESVCKSEIVRSSRTGNPLSVIMADIDHFKHFNDTHGHETGDKILRQFAETISSSIRGIDLAGRLGGEEFLVVCPETDVSGAMLVAEKLRTAVETMRIGQVGGITASFGCASLLTGENSDNLISRADKALYRAKNNGRNRVESDI